MNNLGTAYQAAGNLDLALPLLEEALRLRKAELGPDHPDTLSSMHNLALGYRDAGKLELALPLCEETLKLQRTKLGAEHPETLNTMGVLAATYWSLHRFDRSIPLFEEALRAQEKKLGRQHPMTLFTVGNLGVSYKDSGSLAEALPLLEEAYRARKQLTSLSWVDSHLFDGYLKAGKTSNATSLVEELLDDARANLPKNSPQLAGALAVSGLWLLQAKAFDKAESLLHECLTIREVKQPDEWSTFNTISLLGGALLGKKKYTEAEPLLKKGYEGMKAREEKIPKSGGAELRIPEALDRLIALYTARNKPDEVGKYRAERARYRESKPAETK
jgi:tetratricopeptide (TPR) repeat protein